MTRLYSYPAWNLIRIERGCGAPIHDQVYQQIRSAIVSGLLPRGSRLPASRQLAQEIGVSRNTILIAYGQLSADGYLRQNVGAGTFIQEDLLEDHITVQDSAAVVAPIRELSLSSRGKDIAHIGVSWERTHGYDLSSLVPALDHFPFDTFKRLFAEYWDQLPAADLVYGEPGGFMRLRNQIALYLAEARGIRCDPEQIVVCGSTLQAVSMAAVLLLDAGDKVIVEDPGHVAEIALLKSHNLIPVSVRCDREGLDLRHPPAAVAGAKMIVVTPVGQFPFGSNLRDERRQAIIDWARSNDAWVLEDDANSEYRWAGKPSPPLAAEFGSEQVIYTSSFNRALGPGFRLAYVVVPHPLLESFTAAQQMSGFHVSLPLQHVLTEFMQRGQFATHLRRHRLVYRERAEALVDSLRATFGDRMDIPEIEAGLQLTVVMKEPCDDVAVSNAALRYNLNVDPLSPYCLLEPKLFGFQIGFGNTPVSRIRRGIDNLKRTVDALSADP